MAKQIKTLTDELIDSVLPGIKPIKLFDGGGLFLLINPAGSKLWRFKFRFEGKENSLSFGSYPKVSLDSARVMRSDAQKLLKDGLDPSIVQKMENNLELVERQKADQHASVRVNMDGVFELWKGRLAIRLSIDEARFVRDQLCKLIP